MTKIDWAFITLAGLQFVALGINIYFTVKSFKAYSEADQARLEAMRQLIETADRCGLIERRDH